MVKSKVGLHILITLLPGTGLVILGEVYPPATWTVVQWIGACLIVSGFVLWTIARFQLGGSFALTAQARQLVTRGLYSRFRNPIYYFSSLMIAGVILLVDRPRWLLILAVLAPIQAWRARLESRVLEEKFGEEYRKYRATTWF